MASSINYFTPSHSRFVAEYGTPIEKELIRLFINGNEDVIGYLYVQYYNLWRQIMRKYPSIKEYEMRESLLIEAILLAMRDGGAGLTTMIVRKYEELLIRESTLQSAEKRKSNKDNSILLDDRTAWTVDGHEVNRLLDAVERMDLTDLERRICRAIVKSPETPSVRKIAKETGIHYRTVGRKLEGLRTNKEIMKLIKKDSLKCHKIDPIFSI